MDDGRRWPTSSTAPPPPPSSLFEQKGLALVKDVDAGPARRRRRRRPAAAGRDQPHLERGEVHRRRIGHLPRPPAGRRDRRQRHRHRASASPPADQPKVFEKFKQVGDTLTDKPKGTGPRPADLPRDRRAPRRPHLGGERAGQGQHVLVRRCRSTLADGAAQAPVALDVLVRQLREQPAITAPRQPTAQPNILAVDDDPHIRALLTQEFTEAGYRLRRRRPTAARPSRRSGASGPTWSSST